MLTNLKAVIIIQLLKILPVFDARDTIQLHSHLPNSNISISLSINTE